MARKLKTIYEEFNKYPRELVDETLSKLDEEERKLVTAHYGKDLDKPETSETWNSEKKSFIKI